MRATSQTMHDSGPVVVEQRNGSTTETKTPEDNSAVSESPAVVNTSTQARSISGRVTDTDGKPVAGALLEWGYLLDKPSRWQRTTTDAEGHYELKLHSYGVGYRLGVAAPGKSAQWQLFYAPWNHVSKEPIPNAKAAPPEKIDFKLEPAHHINGVVVDEQGNPIRGVQVEAETSYGLDISSFWGPDWPTPLPGKGPYRTTTGSDGQFALEGLPAEQVSLMLRAPHRHVNTRNYTINRLAAGTYRVARTIQANRLTGTYEPLGIVTLGPGEQKAPGPESGTASPPRPGFGPEHEQTLFDPRRGEPCLIDFDTGRVMSWPSSGLPVYDPARVSRTASNDSCAPTDSTPSGTWAIRNRHGRTRCLRHGGGPLGQRVVESRSGAGSSPPARWRATCPAADVRRQVARRRS